MASKHLNKLPIKLSSNLPWLFAAIIGILGTVLTILLCHSLEKNAQREDLMKRERLTSAVAGEMYRRSDACVNTALTIRNAFIANKLLSENLFNNLVTSLHSRRFLPGPTNILFLSKVPNGGVLDSIAQYETMHRQDDDWGIEIHFSESLDGNHESAFDAVLFSSRLVHQAALDAMRSSLFNLTQLRSESTAESSDTELLLLYPLYQTELSINSELERTRACYGWIAMRIDPKKLFHGLDDDEQGELSVQLAIKEASSLFSSRIPQSSENFATSTRVFEFGGLKWDIVAKDGVAFQRASRLSLWMVGACGLIMSIGLAIHLISIGYRYEQSRNLAATLSVDLLRMATVAQRTTNAVLIVDNAQRLVWSNSGAFELFEGHAAELEGISLDTLLERFNVASEIKQQIDLAIASGDSLHSELMLRPLDPAECCIRFELQPLKTSTSENMGWMLICNDITAQKRADTALKYEHELLRRVMDATPGLIYVKSANGDILLANKMLTDTLNTGDLQITDANVHPRSHDIDSSAAEDLELLDSGTPRFYSEKPLMMPNGDQRYYRIIKTPIVEPHSQLRQLLVVAIDITEQVETREALHRASERLKAATDATNDGLWDFQFDSGNGWCSPQFWKLMGYEVAPSMQEGFQSGLSEFVHPDQRDFVEATIAAHTESDPPLDFELRMRCASGEYRWFRSRCAKKYDDSGTFVRISGSVQDIHERRLAEEALQRSEERWKFALEGSGDGLWDWDIQSGTVTFSDRWKSMLGYSTDEIGNTSLEWSSRIHPKDISRTEMELQSHLAGYSSPYMSEFRMKCKDGSWKWILARGLVVRRDSDGQPLRITGTHSDITAMKNSVQRNHQLASIVTSSSDAIIRESLDGVIETWNSGAETLFGFSATEMVGNKIERLYPSGKADEKNEILKEIKFGRTVKSFETTRITKSGKHIEVSLTISPIFDESNEVVGVSKIARDISDQKRAERELRVAQQRAEQANISKSEFLANMSHEIRTPMTAILGYADLLRHESARYDTSGATVEYLDTIERNGVHLLTLINDILDISKIEAGKLEIENVKTDLKSLVKDVIGLMKCKAEEKHIHLSEEISDELPDWIETDPTRLRQILVNLIGNAIKFTSIGNVTITAKHSAGSPTKIHFEVRDSGIGMSNEQVENLFGAFHQADATTTRRFGGTGLGLYISQRLANMLGGNITASSEFGVGSTFVATIQTAACGSNAFPAAPVPASATIPLQVALPAEGSQRALEGVSILLAEDGLDNQKLIAFHLKKAGASVTIVGNGREAVERLTSDATTDGPLKEDIEFDLIISDMQMPEMDGYTAARILRGKGWTAPILALTANAMQGDAEKCLAAGCSAYLTKPINRQALISACSHWYRLAEQDRKGRLINA